MAKGISLHLGLNAVDPHHYQGWSGELNACEADADDMEAIAKKKEYSPTKLLTKRATRKAVLEAMADAAGKLDKGDIFFLTYSGHGGQVPDMNGDEADRKDETWCLFDGELVDDELYAAYGKFKPGVRIFVLSDSCHSGTVTREMYYQAKPVTRVDAGQARYRAMPRDVALRVYRANKQFYDNIQKSVPSNVETADAIGASVLLISGCQDNQLSQDGDFNGLFTARLLEVWHEGAFKKNYARFHKAIVNLMPPDQTPNLFSTGAVDKAFAKQSPFSI
jgi:hypothetical protein